MGLLSFLFGKTKKIQSAVWGEMNEIVSKNGVTSFSSEVFFKPVNKIIGLTIDTTGVELSHTQEHLFKAIEENYELITKNITPVIENEFRNWKEDFSIADFDNEFELDTISIPYQLQEPVEWEVTFTSIHDLNHWFIVTMHGFDAIEVMIDG